MGWVGAEGMTQGPGAILLFPSSARVPSLLASWYPWGAQQAENVPCEKEWFLPSRNPVLVVVGMSSDQQLVLVGSRLTPRLLPVPFGASFHITSACPYGLRIHWGSVWGTFGSIFLGSCVLGACRAACPTCRLCRQQQGQQQSSGPENEKHISVGPEPLTSPQVLF